jgi:Uma2 family endonuclease
MGMPAQTGRRWTLEEVRALTAGQPGKWPLNELIGGELLVTPAPSLGHARIAFALDQIVVPYVQRHGLGEWLHAPADITLRPGTLVQPDRFLVPSEIARRARTWADVTRLRLVVEVTSPGTARYDRGLKREHYQRAGVDEYWIVDLSSELVERWRPHDERPEVLRERLEWRPDGATEPLVIDLRALFAAVRPESQ